MSTAPIEIIPAAERRRLVVIGLFRALVTTVVVVALFFTVTVFATVGFGDITATGQVARVVVIAQMILDLLVLASWSRCSSALLREAADGERRGRTPNRREQRDAGPVGVPELCCGADLRV